MAKPINDELPVLDDFVVRITQAASQHEAEVVERRIRLLLQPKPRWWPKWFWHRMVSRLLVAEYNLWGR